jgi:pyruvate/2-oxoglutarate dehydrogenase complex dihydrolipoamide acyltransferase (E2) component
MADVTIPLEFWDDDSEGSISSWFFSQGDAVKAGDLIAEVTNEKAANELFAPASGTLTILVGAEIPIRRGQLVAQIERIVAA